MDSKVHGVQSGKNMEYSIQEKLTKKTDSQWVEETSKACQKQVGDCCNPTNQMRLCNEREIQQNRELTLDWPPEVLGRC